MTGSYNTPIGVTCVAMVVVSDAAWTDAAVDNIKMTIESKPTNFQIFPFIIIAFFSGLLAFYLKLALSCLNKRSDEKICPQRWPQ